MESLTYSGAKRTPIAAKQNDELNAAVLEYLLKHGYEETAAKFREEAGAKESDEKKSDFKKDLLEKKWTSVVRLKKQVMELEKLNKQLREESVCARCEALGEMGGAMGHGKIQGDGLPREPEKYTLQGHRGKITKVVIHPFYNLVASASEDASIRLWDTDSGEQDKVMKSHTGIVNYLAFNPNGK